MNKEGFYFSKSCIKNDFLLLSDGEEISKEKDFPFLFILTNVQVKFTNKIVTLKYFHHKFYFSNGEKSKTAYKYIDDVFWDCEYCSIIDVKNNVRMKKSNSLFSNTEYRIELIYFVNFYLIDQEFFVYVKFDCIPTVYDAKKNIAMLSSTPEKNVNPENVQICDKHKYVIEDPNELLNNIQKIDKKFYFYFVNEPKIDMKSSIESESEEIKEIPEKKKSIVKIRPPSIREIKVDEEKVRSNAFLPIVFIFETKKGKEIKQLKKSLPVSITIKEIEKMIAIKRSIKGKITIKYQMNGKKVTVDRSTKIEDIREKIQQKESNDKIVNQMIVEVDDNESNKTKNKKTINFDYSESESSDKIVHSIKKDDADKKKIKKSTKDDDDDFAKARYHVKIKSKYDKSDSDSDDEGDNSSKNKKTTKTSMKSDEDESESSKDKKSSKSLKRSYKEIKQKHPTKKENIYDESDDDDDDNEEEDEEEDDDDEFSQDKNKSKPKAKPKSAYIPKKKEIPIEYNFEYNGNNKSIQILKDSTFKNKENSIKKAFRIDKDDNINFIILTKNGKEIEVEDKDQKIANFKRIISFKIVLQKSKKEDSKSKKLKIRYQANNDKEIVHAILNLDATVKTLKEFIQAKNKVKNIGNIKIIFAGKELLDDISLKSLNVGDSVLFVYIRSEEDILLLTAKALQF